MVGRGCNGVGFAVDFFLKVGDFHLGGPQVHSRKLVAHAGPLTLSLQLEGVFEVKLIVILNKHFQFQFRFMIVKTQSSHIDKFDTKLLLLLLSIPERSNKDILKKLMN